MAWPYGIADPHLYAYLAAAAASYPYGIPQTSPVNYFNNLAFPRPALPPTIPSSPVTSQGLGPLGQYPFPNPLRPNQEPLPGMSSAFLARSPSMPHQVPFHSSPIVGSYGPQEGSPGVLNTSGALNSSGGSISPSLEESPFCNPKDKIHSSRKSPSHLSPVSRSPVASSPIISKPSAPQQTTTPSGLFRPFDTDRS